MSTVDGPRNLRAAQEIADNVRRLLDEMEAADSASYDVVMGLSAQVANSIALGQLYNGIALTVATAANIRRNGAVAGLADGWAEVLTPRTEPATEEPDSLDYAMFTVWLEGNWKWVTKKMTTEAREAAVAAVLRYDAVSGDPSEDRLPRSSLAWWD